MMIQFSKQMWVRQTRLVLHKIFIDRHKYIWNRVLVPFLIGLPKEHFQGLPYHVMSQLFDLRPNLRISNSSRRLNGVVIDIFLEKLRLIRGITRMT